MRRERVTSDAKGWLAGPWESDLPISLGFANEGVDEPHVHSRVTEIYLVTRGSASVRVERTTVELGEGDVLIVEPGEAHTFVGSSEDYAHFVIHSPGVAGEAARLERPRCRGRASACRKAATLSALLRLTRVRISPIGSDPGGGLAGTRRGHVRRGRV